MPSPYRPVFETMEAYAAERRVEPQEAYELYDDYLVDEGLDPTIYLSMAITSGGYARDKQLGIGEVIGKNSSYGDIAKRALLYQHPMFTEADIILPSEVGKMKGWSQSDYLLFWFHVMMGVEKDDAAVISEKITPTLALPGFTDSSLDHDVRWGHYKQLASEYRKLLIERAQEKGGRLEPNNVQAMLMILDGEMSLGGRSEELVCRSLGIPPQINYLDTSTIDETAGMSEHATTLNGLGANAMSSHINPSSLQFLGVGSGETDMSMARTLGMRKTGLINAILAAEYYAQHPTERPLRHQGHTPRKNAA